MKLFWFDCRARIVCFGRGNSTNLFLDAASARSSEQAVSGHLALRRGQDQVNQSLTIFDSELAGCLGSCDAGGAVLGSNSIPKRKMLRDCVSCR